MLNSLHVLQVTDWYIYNALILRNTRKTPLLPFVKTLPLHHHRRLGSISLDLEAFINLNPITFLRRIATLRQKLEEKCVSYTEAYMVL